ncbi:MAG TPA: signal peptidase I [Bacillota bacterium]|jgi:signal peptidase I
MAEPEKSLFRELIETVVFALVLALLIKTFVVETTLVNGPSMQPTLYTGERLWLNKAIYHLRSPRRGEVIVFRNPKNPAKDYIKRAIGLPGDRVAIRDGVVYLNGQVFPENHLMIPQKSNYPETTVPPDSLFVLGDNRANSEDSRFASLGFVPLENVKGKAILIYWPLNRIALVR